MVKQEGRNGGGSYLLPCCSEPFGTTSWHGMAFSSFKIPELLETEISVLNKLISRNKALGYL